MKRTGFFSGSFDPVTLGHTDIIARAARLVDVLVIGIGVHPGKTPMFSVEEKIDMLRADCAPIAKRTGCSIEPVTFAGLTVEAAREAGAAVIFRGLRDGTDLDYEMQMSGMNGAMTGDIDTVFLPASPHVRHIAATLVRQIAQMGGDVSSFVSKDVAKRLKAKVRKK
ncbi:MAG: pantetheine-phosphate adenylyltransferase [Hyphomicrobiales bacterium]|nr:pantetheine-phosphate adenylyltransferase [Hyphomicrobiales bacterium]